MVAHSAPMEAPHLQQIHTQALAKNHNPPSKDCTHTKSVCFMSFLFCNLHMGNLLNDKRSSIKELVDDRLLCFIAINAKTSVDELN